MAQLPLPIAFLVAAVIIASTMWVMAVAAKHEEGTGVAVMGVVLVVVNPLVMVLMAQFLVAKIYLLLLLAIAGAFGVYQRWRRADPVPEDDPAGSPRTAGAEEADR